MTLTLFQGHIESCVKHLNSKVINSLTHQSMYCNSVDLSWSLVEQVPVKLWTYVYLFYVLNEFINEMKIM